MGRSNSNSRNRTIFSGKYSNLQFFGNNIYVAWFSNKSANCEVLFIAWADVAKTFRDKMNLNNSPNSNSVDVDISSDENNVAVSWWETNATPNEPLMKVSIDNAKTFGEKIMISTADWMRP